MSTKPNIIVVLGPTASGKTRLAAHLAYHLNSEVISADSRQVYKHMDIGTGKDYADYIVHNKTIPCHLIDLVEPGSKYHLYQYQQDFRSCFDQLQKTGKTPILCGGTGLYLQAVLSDFQFSSIPKNESLVESLQHQTHDELMNYFHQMPTTAYTNIADLSTHKRCLRAIEINAFLLTSPVDFSTSTPIQPLIIGIHPSREVRRARIEARLKNRLSNGLIEEVESLLTRGVTHDELRYYGLEYKFVSLYLCGELTKIELEEQLQIAIQQFAKRQMTYFRKMERDGFSIHWLDGNQSSDELLQQSLQLIKSNL